MSQVKSAYNFVPAPNEDEVFIPQWADQVSHDIPFEDGESGEIELLLVAETPIFIRNGSSKNSSDNEFSNVVINGEKKYFIPATSLKGMTRNVLEIMSFSRLNKSLVNNDRYSFRDLTHGSEYMTSYSSNNVKAGWLKEDAHGKWVVSECEYNHIHHSEIDSILGTNFRKLFLNKQPIQKDASFKYALCNGANLSSTFGVKESKSKPKGLAVFDSNGKGGTIVFTGQSGPRKEPEGQKPSGKVHEFVFYEGVKTTFELSDKLVSDFKFIYSDHDKNNISPDWSYWREKLEKGQKIPVFFNIEGTRIKHFGLSFMYKLPYEHSVHEMLPFANYSNEIDLSTAIFGFSGKDNSLKGRVYFGHCIADKATPLLTMTEILGGPKASFTPFYLQQENARRNATYQQKGTLKGFKRYPIHSKITLSNYTDDQKKNPKIFTQFTPLDKGATFRSKIRFHNLKPIELGALISALTFHNQSSTFFHSIGAGKSLGYGSLKISVQNIEKFIPALQAFEFAMNTHCTSKLKCVWGDSRQIKELLSVSSLPVSSEIEENLIHPSMSENEFVQIKKDHNHLKNYSTLNPSAAFVSLLNNEVIAKWEKEKEEKEHQKRIKSLELEKEFSDLIVGAHQALDSFDFLKSKQDYESAMKIKNDGSLTHFLNLIENRKKEKVELDAYTQAKTINSIEALTNFLITFPVSQYKEEINQLISKLKAKSGMPERLRNLADTEKFLKECEQWINKLPNKSLSDSGFENEVIDRLLQLAQKDKENTKTIKNWTNDNYKRKIVQLLGEEKTISLFLQINK
jgi:CRISPR-associated protein (TIGR03986 family)